MGKIKDAVYFAVGLLVTIGLIMLGMTFYSKATSLTKTADTGLNDVNNTLSQSKFAEYDNTTVSGTQAINAIRLFASPTFSVTVKTRNNTSGATYTSSTGYNITNISDSNYIEPTAKFRATLYKTGNGTVNCVTLEQQ